ncbi:MAG: class I SAM-dependent rRNA methyltransferase [Acidobacteriota bacterium]
MNTVRVNRKAAGRVASGHPWIFSSDVVSKDSVTPGEAVAVADDRGKILGVAHFSSTSQITLRMLSGTRQELDRAFYLRRLQQALAHRERVVENSNAYRIVSSEGDLLPGLIVDRYGDYLVMQTLTQGMDRAKEVVVDCLTELIQPAGILARNEAGVRKLEGLPQETVVVAGAIPDGISVEMNGLKFTADLLRGQKTGTYLDQRENYVAAARYVRGGRVLDCFSSTGGFALHVARHAESVDAVESSPLAIEAAKANAALNGIENIEFRQADVFDYLSGRDSAKYSMIILDPPAFAKSRKQVDDAMRGYRDINLRALRMLNPGGILVTCSCSHHVSEAALMQTVAEAGLDSGRTLRVLERRTQASDHPILLTVPETLYLKCVILEVLS